MLTYRIVRERQDDVQCGVGHSQSDAPFGKTDGHILHLKASDLPQLLVGQRIEDHDLVETVQQLRAEVPPHLHTAKTIRLSITHSHCRGTMSNDDSERYRNAYLLHDQIASDLHGVLAHHPSEEVLGAEVRCHDDHGVPEVHRPALPIRQPAVVEDLEQGVEHGDMGLLDLVEQDHAVRPPPHLFSQLPTLFMADVASVTGGAPMRRATECCSMYSDMSMRTRRFSSSNSCSARALASSVFPTPVGPRKRNEPVGCCGLPRPALDLSTASATALTASVWPTTLW
uniref:Uncharacterized protein n=1 Tax=Zea mays TaxID=4577 RepID=C0HG24_MAIZE|nr:unknown [Zea mays]